VSERVAPHALDAERSVLGKLLLKPAHIADVAGELNASEFYRSVHGDIYEHMVDLWRQGVSVDMITLSDSLRRAGKLDAIGGQAYLSRLTDGLPVAGLESHVDIVRDKARARALIQRAESFIASAHDGDEIDDLIEQAEAQIRDINRGVRGGFIDGPALAGRILAAVQTWHSTDGPSGLLTGFSDLDEATTGFHAGDLVLLAGRPSMGKSQLAGQIAYHVAVRQRCPVAYFSLEMDPESIGVRMVCAETKLDLHYTRHGWLREHDQRRFTDALRPIEEGVLFLDEGVTVRVADMRRKVRHLQAQHGLAMVVVDYIQLLDPPAGSRAGNRNEDVSAISRALKVMGKELKVPVLALSQLSRRCEMRPDKRPIMSDLRESGALEQDADIVLFLYRPEVYEKSDANAGQAELIIGKQRNGPLETIALTWTSRCVRFDSVTRSGVAA
jgi:replicative DNA helicase